MLQRGSNIGLGRSALCKGDESSFDSNQCTFLAFPGLDYTFAWLRSHRAALHADCSPRLGAGRNYLPLTNLNQVSYDHRPLKNEYRHDRSMSSMREIREYDEAGELITTYVESPHQTEQTDTRLDILNPQKLSLTSVWQQLLGVFLPVGFPHSVTADYLEYQIYDSLQAFASSIAGLISSRAVLEGGEMLPPFRLAVRHLSAHHVDRRSYSWGRGCIGVGNDRAPAVHRARDHGPDRDDTVRVALWDGVGARVQDVPAGGGCAQRHRDGD